MCCCCPWWWRRDRTDDSRREFVSSMRSSHSSWVWCLTLMTVSCLLLSSSVLVAADDESVIVARSWTLYHKIQSDYSPRGTVTLELLSGSPSAASVASPASPEARFSYTPVAERGLTEEIATQLLHQPMYQLKLVEDGAEGDATPPVHASVPSCSIRRANFRDEIVLTVNAVGKVLSMQYSPLISQLAPADCNDESYYSTVLPYNRSQPLDDLGGERSFVTNFATTITWEMAVPGMSVRTVLPNYKAPPGLKRIPGAQALPRKPTAAVFPEDETPPEAKQQGMFGFFRRYWYILVPMMIVNIFSGGSLPEQSELEPNGQPLQPQQSQQQQQQQQPQQQKGAVASSPASSASTSRRRGKRD